ncbi:MAG: hypothetical protein IKR86_01860 [Candidatus Methanomethylophilaceae archaeon]|nr:hypothetical protein [Candidatus Methanomethylophilaceae archaeon]
MWGYEAALRVRDRKIGEMARVMGYTNADRRYKLLGELGRDLEICNCAISGSGVCAIPSVPVSDPGYRSALSGQDLEDELDLDSARVAAPQFRDMVKSLFQDAARYASEDRSEPYREAVGALKEELRSCRDRLEQLSAEMDYKRSELEASEEDRRCLQETVGRQQSEIVALKSRLSEMTDDAGILRARMEELSAQIEELKSAASGALPGVPEEPSEEPALSVTERPEPVPEAAFDSPAVPNGPSAQTNEEPKAAPEPSSEASEKAGSEKEMMGRAKAMKASKIDLFLDMMLSGDMDIDVCDDLVNVLKVDISIIDALCSSGDLSSVPFAAQLSPDEAEAYESSLSEDEKALEKAFRSIVEKAYEGRRGNTHG